MFTGSPPFHGYHNTKKSLARQQKAYHTQHILSAAYVVRGRCGTCVLPMAGGGGTPVLVLTVGQGEGAVPCLGPGWGRGTRG